MLKQHISKTDIIKNTMKNIEEIKIESFKNFLKRLSQHKLGECMDIVPMDVNYEKIIISKQ